MAPTLGYWDIRGLAEPIRLLLHYFKADFVDKRYEMSSEGDPRAAWLAEKFKLGLELPNLPYYIDGDIKMTQSNAILRHIARKHNMYPHSEAELIRLDMIADQVMDFRMGFARLCYNPDYDNLVEEYRRTLPEKLQLFADFLGSHHYLLGDKPSFPDFHFYELLDIHLEWDAESLKNFTTLQAYHKRFQELPGVHEYLNSSKFKRRPVNGAIAKWK